MDKFSVSVLYLKHHLLKYESGTEGKYYPISIQEIRKSPFRSLVQGS